RVQHRLLRRFVAILFVVVRAAVGVEMPADVHVRVDAARHQRAPAEVDVEVLWILLDRDDLVAVDDDRRVRDNVAAPVEDAVGTDREGSEEERAQHGRDCKMEIMESKSHDMLKRVVAPIAVWAVTKALETPQVKKAMRRVDDGVNKQRKKAQRSLTRISRNA